MKFKTTSYIIDLREDKGNLIVEKRTNVSFNWTTNDYN